MVLLLIAENCFCQYNFFRLYETVSMRFQREYTLFYKQREAETSKKIKQMLNNTLRLNFCYLKIIHILYPHYHPKITQHTLKNKQKNMYVCIHEIIQVILTKMKKKMENRSNRYDMDTNIDLHGYKFSKCKKCLSMIMLIRIKQHLGDI